MQSGRFDEPTKLGHSENTHGESEPLSVHLQSVASRCSKFTGAFGCEDEGRVCGLLHDLGKMGTAGQKRMQGIGRGVDHPAYGAFCLAEIGQLNTDLKFSRFKGSCRTCSLTGTAGEARESEGAGQEKTPLPELEKEAKKRQATSTGGKNPQLVRKFPQADHGKSRDEADASKKYAPPLSPNQLDRGSHKETCIGVTNYRPTVGHHAGLDYYVLVTSIQGLFHNPDAREAHNSKLGIVAWILNTLVKKNRSGMSDDMLYGVIANACGYSCVAADV